ncbi:MAG: hypothetical protein JNK72_05840 [Myxococcales bacterium]|nr:hypothetical protein [Myxococcales bacterium]
MKRLVIGLVKGLLVGGALGAALHFGLGATTLIGPLAYVFYAVVGALAGLLAGRPAWREGAGVAAILRAVFGLGVGVGLYALAGLLKFEVPLAGVGAGHTLQQIPLLLAPTIATVYATLVEVDDGGENPEPAVQSKVRINLEDIKVDEEEAPAQNGARARKKA